MKTLGILIPTGLAGLLAAGALAYDSPTAQGPIPRHSCPWIETTRPDLQTLFLWKLSSDKDRQAEVSTALDKGDIGTLLENETGFQDMGRAKEGPAPRLQGGARAVPDVGRFGGGLVLEGSGFAEGSADLRGLLKAEGGFTLDLWFKPTAPGNLCVLNDTRGQPLLVVALGADQRVTLTFDGQERLAVPVEPAGDAWHHLAVTLRGAGDQLTLTVDGQTTAAVQPAWLRGLAARLGSQVIIGSGFRGVMDEVRLSKGVKYLYPWNLGGQERTRRREDLELRPPFFKGSQVLTRFRFDSDLKPDVFAGLSWTGRTEAAQFVPGVQGQALDLSRIGQAGFEIAGSDFLPERNGTIEFWFRPLDWNNFYVGEYDGRDVGHQLLMTFRAPGEADYQASKNIEVVKGRSWQIAHQRRADGSSAVAWAQVHPGTWTHVLITLADNGAQTVYLNGRQQKFHQLGLVLRGAAFKAWQDKTGGEAAKDRRRWTFVASPTLVDELSVFGWAMNAEEAWNAYARWLPDAAAQMKPLPVFRVDFDYFAHSWDMKEKLQIHLACLPVGDTKPASADCELRDEKGAVLLAAQKQPLDETSNATFTLDRALPFGRYPVVVRSRDAAGAVLKEQKQEYVREQPAWFGNTLGKDRTVPKPWTPVVVDGRTLRLVGREIELGANGLPARLVTLQQPVLAAPVTVRAGTAELTGQGPTFTETAPDRVAWKCALAGGGLTADLEAWMEFDGLLYCAITLKPAGGAETTVEDLKIDVPMVSSAATQLLANGGGKDFRNSWIAKYVPQGTGSVWNSLDKPYPSFVRAFEVSNFMPHIWLGNDAVGLYFGAENDQGWTVDGPKPAQEILREGDRVVFRMNILREPTPIPTAGRRFHFVLLPTPAKPEPPDWRKQMLGKVNFTAVDQFSGFSLKTDPSDPENGDSFRLEPRSWEYAAEAAPKCRTKNRADGFCILYADASWPGLGPAFRDWRHNMWADTGKLAWTPEFEDYAVWAINEYLQRGLIDGVYWDDVSVGSTLLLRGGAYEYAGSPKGRRVGFTALAQRRVNLRLWRLFEAAGKEPCIWAHMTACYEVPLFSFCRYLSNCEFVTGVNFPGRRDAMDMWSADTLRILGGSAKWGTGYSNLSTLPRQLPVSAAAKQWSYPQQRTETGLYLTSDTMGPADGLGQVLVKEKVFDGPVRAYPWWKANEVLKVTAPTNAQPLAIVYALAGRAVVIVANRDRGSEHEFALELDVAKLFPGASGVTWRDLDPGLKPPPAVAATTKEIKETAAQMDDAALGDLLEGTTPEGRTEKRLALRVEGNTARVVVRPRDYRILEARQ